MAPAICYVCWQYVCSPYPAVFGSVMVQMSWDDPVPCCYVVNVQSVSWLVDITAGGNFLGLCDQKSSYKRVSDFGRLRSYGHFLIPVHALVWTASYGTSWPVMYSTRWRIVCGSCNEQLAQLTTERQPVLRPAALKLNGNNMYHTP